MQAMQFQTWFMRKNEGLGMSILKSAIFNMLAAASSVFLFVIGFRMTEQFMEQLDNRAERKLNSRSA